MSGDASAWVLALAPMEGVTDACVRDVISALGGVDYCVTEFVRVSGEVLSAKAIDRACPELRANGRTRFGTPVHFQLLGGDPDRMARSACVAAERGATVIDLNFGCPAPTVNRHDGGASLLRDPRRVEAVTASVRAAVPRAIPVSAKVRLGWDDPDGIVEIARAAESGGAAWLTVHGRTRAQGYAPPADWVRIGAAREAVSIPVVANGDLRSVEDIQRCARESGCTRFMLGRGAIDRPELFRRARGLDARAWEPWRRLALVEHYARSSLAHGPGRERVTLCRMKQWLRALASAASELGACRDTVMRIEDVGAARDVIARYCETLERGEISACQTVGRTPATPAPPL